MKLKKNVPLLLLLLISTHLTAGVTDIVRLSGYYASGFNGGEFTVGQLTPGLQSVLSLYAGVAKNQGHNQSFQTFCLELSEGTASDVEYTINPVAIKGGAGTVPALGGDPLADPTAWLYKQFATGNINNFGPTVYDYTPGSGREVSARGFQKAVWFLEEVIAFDAEAQPFLDLYVDTVLGGDSGSYTLSDYQNLRLITNAQTGVAVFNPYVYKANGDIAYKQSQLILVPAPGALILASMGMAFVSYLRNRKRV